MKRPICFLSLFLLALPLCAKTSKVDVRVKVDIAIKREKAQGNLSLAVNPIMISYVNVTMSSDDAEAVAKNNGQWCIQSQDEYVELPKGAEYQGVLNGDFLEIAIPQKNGKVKKVSFKIFDYKWRTPYDLPGGPAAAH